MWISEKFMKIFSSVVVNVVKFRNNFEIRGEKFQLYVIEFVC